MSLEENCLEFWMSYLDSSGIEEDHPIIEAGIAGSPEIADTLLELYLSGKKSAGSGLVKDYELAGDDLPQSGRYWIVLDSKNEPRCILKTTSVEINKFKNIPQSVAFAEGEGDLSVGYWKKVHREFFNPFLEGWGIEDIDEEEVVTEFFELVYP